MMNQTSDMLIRIKNACLARHKVVIVSHFRFGEKLVHILIDKGFLAKVEVEKPKGEKFKKMIIDLVYRNKKPVLTDLRIISKPGLRVYLRASKIKRILRETRVSIISTSRGLMIGEEAKKKNLGGELICEVW